MSIFCFVIAGISFLAALQERRDPMRAFGCLLFAAIFGIGGAATHRTQEAEPARQLQRPIAVQPHVELPPPPLPVVPSESISVTPSPPEPAEPVASTTTRPSPTKTQREWETANGIKFVGTLKVWTSTRVAITKEDGSIFETTPEQLSQADRAWFTKESNR